MTPTAPAASVAERLEEALERETPHWGIRPVPDALRRFSGLDLAVLWGDLSIGLLVLVSGALLVPGLGLPMAVFAIVIGTVIGCLPLGLVAAAGARDGVPSMVLFRPVLGLRGSYVPSVANLVQLIGWTAFEFWAMGRVANAVSISLFGLDATFLWMLLVAVWFYLPGALLVRAAGSGPDVLDLGATIAAAAGGGVVLVVLLVGESDNAMANVYSSAVSMQNARPAWSQRALIIAVGAAEL